MNGYFSHAGFHITRHKLQLVEVVKEPGSYTVSNISEVYFSQPLNFNTQKETIIGAQLQTALDELQINKPIKSTSASFVLPYDLFYTAQLPYDNSLLQNDLVEEFKWEISILYPFVNPYELTLQFIEVEKNMIITKNTAIVTGINRKYIKILDSLCNKNNFSLRFIDVANFAAERSIAFSENFSKDGLTLSLFFSNDTMSLLLSLNTKLLYQKSMKVNGDSEIIGMIKEEITPSESKFIQKDLISNAFISGENITHLFVEKLKNSLKLDFKKFNPFDKIKVNSEIEGNRNIKEKYNSFSPAAGIAYRLS